MAIQQDGIIGEKLAMDFLHKKGLKVFQPDVIAHNEKMYMIGEAKFKHEQEFDGVVGHTIPYRQVKARLEAYKDTGLRCMFIVFDKDEPVVYYEWLDFLYRPGYYVYHENFKSVLFPINRFRSEPSDHLEMFKFGGNIT